MPTKILLSELIKALEVCASVAEVEEQMLSQVLQRQQQMDVSLVGACWAEVSFRWEFVAIELVTIMGFGVGGIGRGEVRAFMQVLGLALGADPYQRHVPDQPTLQELGSSLESFAWLSP